MDTTQFEAAVQQLRLTPQEQALYQRHLMNLYGAGKVVHPDGGISTLYQMSITGPDNKTYNIPTVYDGKIVDPDDAIRRARKAGLWQFPSYLSQALAEDRYQQMHHYMDRDVGRYRQQFNPLTEALNGH